MTACQSFLQDKHYAISESAVDAARAKHKAETGGNWLEFGFKTFRQKYGQVVETEVGDEDDEPDDGTNCQTQLCPGVCRNALTPRYFDLFEDVKSLLRVSRDGRRKDGYKGKHHIPLVFTLAESREVSEIYLLTRLSYSPFDATAMEFYMVSDTRANLKTNADGHALFWALPLLLKTMSQRQPQLGIVTCGYSAVSLPEIELDCAWAAPQAAQQVHVVSDESEADDEDEKKGIAARAGLLKLTTGKAPQGKAKGRPRKDAGVRRHPKRAKGNGNGNANPQLQEQPAGSVEEEGAAKQSSNDIMEEWASAFKAQLGPIPITESSGVELQSKSKPKPKHLPSKSAETVGTDAASASSGSKGVPVPVLSKEHPWKDAKGQCWVYNHETQRPSHMGYSAFTIIFCCAML